MTIGFKPQNFTRQPIYGEQVARKVGYVQHDARGIWFCDPTGRKLGRVLRYKPHQAPQANSTLASPMMAPYGLG